MSNFKQLSVDELMICELAKQVRNFEISATGTLSPIPAAACYLAKETHAPDAKLLIFNSPEWPLSGELEELFNIARQGKLDLFFLSGAQIDRWANLNLVAIGSYEKPKVRLPGGAGSSMLYHQAKRTALFLRNQTERSLVNKVDFITAAPLIKFDSKEITGPSVLVTDKGVFKYDHKLGLIPESIHPHVTTEKFIKSIGFDVGNINHLPVTILPDDSIIEVLRGKVKELLYPVYPEFVNKVWE